MLAQIDLENADRDLTSLVTVLTHTPSTSRSTACRGLILLGDGVKDLDGSGGNFELVITVGGQTIQPSPQIICFGTEVRSSVYTIEFPVPAGAEVAFKIKSPNAADTDVDVTARLYTQVDLASVKAVQNKSTGVIEYYDYDGETIIITQTPTDEEATITRTPS